VELDMYRYEEVNNKRKYLLNKYKWKTNSSTLVRS
jgi:hypothetical protein